MMRHCGCRYWRLGPFVLFWPCCVFVASLAARRLPEHEDYARACWKYAPTEKADLP